MNQNVNAMNHGVGTSYLCNYIWTPQVVQSIPTIVDVYVELGPYLLKSS